ncbi:MAG: hydantoinase B/oxoprolinase family protein, partial [Pseudomonadota bacterium]|nr:hydantoinase B/oxoprolinase family protein [Pseudomonadota bacterium]
LHEGSAGAGRTRGGFGLDYELELRNGNAKASFVMDHGRFGPQGALGGGDGDVNKVVVFRDGESYVPLHLSKEQDIPLETGDRVWVRTPGGGGYGDPLQRSAALVLEDVRLERYTIEQAADLYGVVLLVSTGSEGNHGLTLDEIATEARRATLRASR